MITIGLRWMFHCFLFVKVFSPKCQTLKLYHNSFLSHGKLFWPQTKFQATLDEIFLWMTSCQPVCLVFLKATRTIRGHNHRCFDAPHRKNSNTGGRQRSGGITERVISAMYAFVCNMVRTGHPLQLLAIPLQAEKCLPVVTSLVEQADWLLNGISWLWVFQNRNLTQF